MYAFKCDHCGEFFQAHPVSDGQAIVKVGQFEFRVDIRVEVLGSGRGPVKEHRRADLCGACLAAVSYKAIEEYKKQMKGGEDVK